MFVEACIDLDHVNQDGDTAMMMTGDRCRQSHLVMKLFFELGAKSCFVNNQDYSLVESLLFTSRGVIMNE